MYSLCRSFARLAVITSLGLSLLATACSTEDPIFTGVDAIASYPVTIELGGSGTGMVIAPLAGITCPGSCTAMVQHGSQLSITASTAAASLFMGWTVGSGGTACAGTGDCTTTITGPTPITATFAVYQSLEVTKSSTGHGTVTSSPTGIDCGTDCSETYPPGRTVTLTATAASDSIFMGWSGSGCSGTDACSVDVNGATMVTADFQLMQYDLTVSKAGLGVGTVTSTPAGIDCGATCTAAYDAGTMVTLTASPAVSSLFAGWSGGGCTGTAACTVTMAAATTVTATFGPILDTLTVERAGTGAGTVTSSPAGINCGTDCSESYQQGTMVTLTASTSTGSVFSGWSGGGCSGTGTCTVTMTSANSVTATFTLNQYTLTVSKTGSGTVTSSPAGINCGTDCTETVNHGTVLTLTATPAAGSTFGGWSGGGCSGTGTCVVTATATTTVTAAFTLTPYALTVTKTGTGTGTVTSTPAGINCGTDCTEPYPNGTMVTLTAVAGTGSTFGGWSGGGCTGTGTCIVTITAAVNVTATFTLNTYTLTVAKSGTGTVTSSPTGIDCGTNCTAVIGHGMVVTLTAVPATGFTFTGWSGGGCSGTGTCAVTVTATATVTATFTLNTYALAINPAGTGAGTVTSSPVGINCGATCSATFSHNTLVALTATPAPGSIFSGWSGGICTGTGTCNVTMTAAAAVTATFTLNTYTLSVSLAGTGSGSVTSSPAGINCGADCSEVVGHGIVMTLTATPATGSTFTGWSGGGCTGTGTCAVPVTTMTGVTATFTLNNYTLTVAKSGSGTVTSSPTGINCGTTCSQSVSYGSMVTLTATPATGSTFAGWSGGGCTGTGTCSVTVTSATTVTANFMLNTYTLTVTKGGAGSGTVTSSPAGINCGTSCTGVYSHGTSVTLTATPAPGSGWAFAGWSGACSGMGTCTVPMTGPADVHAIFENYNQPLSITINDSGNNNRVYYSSPGGGDSSCYSSCQVYRPIGTVMTLTAEPYPGWTFTGWSGSCTGTGICTVIVGVGTTVTANFALTLSVSKTGAGTGTVQSTSSPPINCGSTCSNTYPYGTTVQLIATPGPNSVFVGWSSSGCSGTGSCPISLHSNTNVTARFEPSNVTLSVSLIDAVTGSYIYSSPGSIDCRQGGGGTCSDTYPYGSIVQLTLAPGPSGNFLSWTGACSGQGQVCYLTLTSNTSTVGRTY